MRIIVKTFYRDGRLRSVVAEKAIHRRPDVSPSHPAIVGLQLADIVPANGTPTITAYIQA